MNLRLACLLPAGMKLFSKKTRNWQLRCKTFSSLPLGGHATVSQPFSPQKPDQKVAVALTGAGR